MGWAGVQQIVTLQKRKMELQPKPPSTVKQNSTTANNSTLMELFLCVCCVS